MCVVTGLSTEENVACQLADLAFRLHKRGLMEPYQKVVEARDALLLILDDPDHHVGGDKAGKKEKATVTSCKLHRLAEPARPRQDTETRKSEYEAA